MEYCPYWMDLQRTMIDERVLNHSFILGLNILCKYSQGRVDMHAEHDIIYAGPSVSEEEVSEEDKNKLEELGGWHFSDEGDCWAFFC